MNNAKYISPLLLLVVGAMIYVFFREPVLFTFPIKELIGNNLLIELHHSWWFDFLRYNIPDLLWCVALINYSHYAPTLFLKYTSLSLPLVMEISQISTYVPGTFDIIDLTIYIILITSYLMIWNTKKSKATSYSTL